MYVKNRALSFKSTSFKLLVRWVFSQHFWNLNHIDVSYINALCTQCYKCPNPTRQIAPRSSLRWDRMAPGKSLGFPLCFFWESPLPHFKAGNSHWAFSLDFLFTLKSLFLLASSFIAKLEDKLWLYFFLTWSSSCPISCLLPSISHLIGNDKRFKCWVISQTWTCLQTHQPAW